MLIQKTDVKRILSKPDFWAYFPEYPKPDKLKVGCCSLSLEVYYKVLEWIKKNPNKWKAYLKTDKLTLFGNGKVIDM